MVVYKIIKYNDMRDIYIRWLLFLLPVFLFSCVKEQGRDKCPPEYSMILGVKDKNYSNINSVPTLHPQDEQLPFREYITNLSYRLQELGTGNVVVSVSNQYVTDNDQLETILFPGLAAGRYILTLFGNISQTPEFSNVQSVYHLHPDEQEDMDTYVLYDTLDFSPASSSEMLELQRAKGYLFIQMEGLPDSVGRIEQQVGLVYRDVDQNLNYTVETSVIKSFTGSIHSSATLSTTLSPTLTDKESSLRLAFYKTGETTPFMFLPDIRMVVRRNQVTAFLIKYKPEGGVEVWMSVEGAWEKQHDMDFQ